MAGELSVSPDSAKTYMPTLYANLKNSNTKHPNSFDTGDQTLTP